VALIPDHAVLFSNKAIAMKFSWSQLREDIDVFSDLVHYGEVPATYRFWFDQLQTKLLDAQPNLFTLASDLLNLRLEFRPTESFAQTIARAIEIATRLQTSDKLVQVFKGSKPHKVFKSADRKRKSDTRAETQASAKRGKVIWGRLENSLKNSIGAQCAAFMLNLQTRPSTISLARKTMPFW
jgi:hypothetical protein